MWSRRAVLLGCPGLALAAAARAEIADGFVVLRAREAQAPLAGTDQPPLPVWGYDGRVPGPTIRVKRGAEVKVRVVNELAAPTAIHWHGVRLPNPMDGTPLTGPPVMPGASFDYRFVAPDAGTFWYRAQDAAQCGRGLHGPLIIEEPEPPAVDRDYAIVFAAWQADGGESVVTVNGGTRLDLATRAHERLRLRFVNASLTRPMSARVDRHRVVVMALDGEPAEPFTARDDRVVLGPGNRADVFVDAGLAPGSSAPILFATEAGETELARLVYADGAPARPAPLPEPPPLPANPLPDRMNFTRAQRVTVRIGEPAENGGAAPLFIAERGRTVVLAFENRSAAAHAVHPHGHHVRLLDRLDDGWKPYWLDTVLVPERSTARIAFIADNPGRWLIEDLGDPSAGVWFQVK